jgi:hypothetical protein
MGLMKIKNPGEYSFHQWISAYPDSGHWADKARFYTFVRTICRFNAKRWKDTAFVRGEILRRRPHFDVEFLDYLMRLLNELIEYSKAYPIKAGLQSSDLTVTDGHYIEITVKRGRLEMKEKPYSDAL